MLGIGGETAFLRPENWLIFTRSICRVMGREFCVPSIVEAVLSLVHTRHSGPPLVSLAHKANGEYL